MRYLVILEHGPTLGPYSRWRAIVVALLCASFTDTHVCSQTFLPNGALRVRHLARIGGVSWR